MAKEFDLEKQLRELGIEIGQISKEIENRAKQSMGLLQQQIYGKIIEKAQSKLRSTRSTYIANLGMLNETDNLWVVYLKKEAAWIEDGLKAGDMRPDIIHSGKQPKISKEGHAYKVIPFQHNKNPQTVSRSQMQIQNIVKKELKSRGLDKPILVDGRPKLGRAASLDLVGKGMPTSKFNVPLLKGLTIYQREEKLKNGKSKLKRDVMTFRVISDKTKGDGSWERPHMEGAKLFEEVEKEVEQMWDQIFKDIVDNIKIENKGSV